MLFGFENPNQNLLPYDGEVYYRGVILEKHIADFYFAKLLENIEWKNDQAIIFGKLIETKRKVAWYADEAFDYTYSKISKTAILWTEELLFLKNIVEKHCGESFNSCLINLYHNGNEGMAWHSDGEKDLKKDATIASLSLGAVRRFGFKHKKIDSKVYINLEHGSLLLMQGKTQSNWLHRLPPSTKITEPRINLTFRNIVK